MMRAAGTGAYKEMCSVLPIVNSLVRTVPPLGKIHDWTRRIQQDL